MRMILLGAVSAGFLFSCGESPKTAGHSVPLREWNDANNPFIMDTAFIQQNQYVQKFQDLPTKGELKKKPWSDDYWPTASGGISYRWNDSQSSDTGRYAYSFVSPKNLTRFDLKRLSPSEKFDIFLGRMDYPYTKMERTRTEILRTVSSNSHYDPHFEIPEWEGLCHAWAPATLFFDEPKPVVMTGRTGIEVPFGSSDIKALLTYFLNEAEAPSRFLGTRCEVDVNDLRNKYKRGMISKRSYQEQLESCSGVNPGAFHIVIANQIGRLNEGFVVDVDPGPEVWNQPIYGFSTQVLSEHKGKSSNAAPSTVKELEVRTRMDYIEEVEQSWEPSVKDGAAHKDYHYRLEIDAAGDIVGGVWLDADHPDFAWKQELPSFGGDFIYVKEIYEASVGHEAPEHVISNKPRARATRNFSSWFSRR